MNKLEQMNPLFVSMFVMLADISLLTSPRFDKHKEKVIDVVDNYSKKIHDKDGDVFVTTWTLYSEGK